jgi:hypothetical protein
MGNIQELEKQLAEAKAEEKRKELQTLTENLISKYKESLRESQFRKKNRSAYASAVFYEKFWVTGNDNSIEMEHILLQSRKKLQILK